MVDAVATHDADAGATSVFVVNRSLDETVTIDIDVRLLGDVELGEVESLYDDDIHAANTLDDRDTSGSAPQRDRASRERHRDHHPASGLVDRAHAARVTECPRSCASTAPGSVAGADPWCCAASVSEAG